MSQLIVRPLQTAAEAATFFKLAAQVFLPDQDADSIGERWLYELGAAPGFELEQIRGAFLRGPGGDGLAGGLVVFDRQLRVPPALVPTGGIGMVITHTEYRRRGIARMLLEDALDYGLRRGYALMMLDGIPNFYHQWGFVDIFDSVEYAVDRRTLLELPPSPCGIRAATPDDAATMLELYRQHHHAYAGSFERTLEEQRHSLRYQPASPVLAVDADGIAQGYLLWRWSSDRTHAREAVADTWAATLALLQAHARLFDAQPDPPQEIWWPLPPDSHTLHLILDNILRVAYAGSRETPRHTWTPVRGEVVPLIEGGWMARTLDRSRLIAALLPRWQAHWRLRPAGWRGPFELVLGGERFTFQTTAQDLRLEEATSQQHPRIELDDETFLKLLFGYRNLRWASQQGRIVVASGLDALLHTLFPTEHVWIPRSDWF